MLDESHNSFSTLKRAWLRLISSKYSDQTYKVWKNLSICFHRVYLDETKNYRQLECMNNQTIYHHGLRRMILLKQVLRGLAKESQSKTRKLNY